MVQFFIFVLLGILFSFVFDFFRAIRRRKKVSIIKVYIQDIIYFLIIGTLLILTMINYVTEPFRLYLLIGIILGIMLYIGLAGNYIMEMFIQILNMWYEIIMFIFLPLQVLREIFAGQIYFIKKVVIKCCKKMSYMVNSKYTYMKKTLLGRIIKRGNVKICRIRGRKYLKKYIK